LPNCVLQRCVPQPESFWQGSASGPGVDIWPPAGAIPGCWPGGGVWGGGVSSFFPHAATHRPSVMNPTSATEIVRMPSSKLDKAAELRRYDYPRRSRK
jgi:hypothetical protein